MEPTVGSKVQPNHVATGSASTLTQQAIGAVHICLSEKQGEAAKWLAILPISPYHFWKGILENNGSTFFPRAEAGANSGPSGEPQANKYSRNPRSQYEDQMRLRAGANKFEQMTALGLPVKPIWKSWHW
jgi:hypothetical protein